MVLCKQPFDKIALYCAHKFSLAEIRECTKMICGWDTHTHHSKPFWWVYLYICRPEGSVMTCIVQSKERLSLKVECAEWTGMA
jgi:hypothetical protein